MTPPTQPQIIRLYTLAGAAGLDHAGVHAELWDRYGIESSRHLDKRQYEAFCRELATRGRARATVGQVGNLPAEAAMHYPRVCDRQGCLALLHQAWPQIVAANPILATALAELLDCFRLTRKAGAISPRLLVVLIQKMQKLPLDALTGAAAVYLERYSMRDENYFLGICRRILRDSARDAKPIAQESASRHPSTRPKPAITYQPRKPADPLTAADRAAAAAKLSPDLRGRIAGRREQRPSCHSESNEESRRAGEMP